MKKITTLMLGLALVLGTTAFAQESKDTTKKEGKKGKKSSKKTDSTTTAPAPTK